MICCYCCSFHYPRSLNFTFIGIGKYLPNKLLHLLFIQYCIKSSISNLGNHFTRQSKRLHQSKCFFIEKIDSGFTALQQIQNTQTIFRGDSKISSIKRISKNLIHDQTLLQSLLVIFQYKFGVGRENSKLLSYMRCFWCLLRFPERLLSGSL